MGLSGVSIYGSIAMGGVGSMDYQFLMGTQNIDGDDSGIAKDIENDVRYTAPELDIDNIDVSDMYVGMLQWRSPWGVRVGGTLNYLSFDATGSNGAGVVALLDATNIRNYTASIEYTWEDLIIAAEYWNLEFDQEFYSGGALAAAGTVEKEGWYVSASYRVNEWLEVGSYYSAFYPDDTDHTGSDILGANNKHEAYSKDWAISARFDINEYWTFKMEGHRINGKGNVYAADNGVVNALAGPPPALITGDYTNSNGRFNVFVAKMTFSF